MKQHNDQTETKQHYRTKGRLSNKAIDTLQYVFNFSGSFAREFVQSLRQMCAYCTFFPSWLESRTGTPQL